MFQGLGVSGLGFAFRVEVCVIGNRASPSGMFGSAKSACGVDSTLPPLPNMRTGHATRALRWRPTESSERDHMLRLSATVIITTRVAMIVLRTAKMSCRQQAAGQV